MKKIVFVTLLLAVYSSNALAYYEIGNELREGLEAMENNQSTFESGFAAGFITGVADTADKVLFCIPQEASAAQMAAIVVKYFKANPEEWNKSAARLVITCIFCLGQGFISNRLYVGVEYCLVLPSEYQMTFCAIGQEAVAAAENLLEVAAVLKFSG